MRSCPLGQALVFLRVHVLEPNRGNICFTAVLTAPDLHTPPHTHRQAYSSGWACQRKSVTTQSTHALILKHTHRQTHTHTQMLSVFLSSSSCHNHCAVCPPALCLCHQDLLWQLLWHPNLSVPFSVWPYIGPSVLFLLICLDKQTFYWLDCAAGNFRITPN